MKGDANHRHRVAAVVVMVVLFPVVLFVGYNLAHVVLFVTTFGDPVPSYTPTDSVTAFGFAKDAFYAGVRRVDSGEVQWIRSADGGATWSAATGPGRLSKATGFGPVRTDCATDGVCYRVRHETRELTPSPVASPSSETPSPSATSTVRNGRPSARDGFPRIQRNSQPQRVAWYLVERREPGGPWFEEAGADSRIPALSSLAVDPAHSDRAMAESLDGVALYRTGTGVWKRLDLMALADGLR